MLFSEPKIPHVRWRRETRDTRRVSVLFSEPKIPQPYSSVTDIIELLAVSVLFSEPKIPHVRCPTRPVGVKRRFSALQRAENSSLRTSVATRRSSIPRFSALQRAENSSAQQALDAMTELVKRFSALQRAENSSATSVPRRVVISQRFSALQRAENSSGRTVSAPGALLESVSVLFSEPKIPQPTLAPASIHISDRDDHASSFLSLPGASP